jgi:hypothetical protein
MVVTIRIWAVTLNWNHLYLTFLIDSVHLKSCVCCQATSPFPPDIRAVRVSFLDPLKPSLLRVVPKQKIIEKQTLKRISILN